MCSEHHLGRHLCANLIVATRGAGRWPDDPRAHAKAKAAMGCQLAEELASGFGLRAAASEHCVDVLADGFAFRLFLTSERCGAPPICDAFRLLALRALGAPRASSVACAHCRFHGS